MAPKPREGRHDVQVQKYSVGVVHLSQACTTGLTFLGALLHWSVCLCGHDVQGYLNELSRDGIVGACPLSLELHSRQA